MIEFCSTGVLIMLTFFQSWSMLISRVNLLYQYVCKETISQKSG